MPAFFEDIEAFRGDGSRNEKGESLEAFLKSMILTNTKIHAVRWTWQYSGIPEQNRIGQRT